MDEDTLSLCSFCDAKWNSILSGVEITVEYGQTDTMIRQNVFQLTLRNVFFEIFQGWKIDHEIFVVPYMHIFTPFFIILQIGFVKDISHLLDDFFFSPGIILAERFPQIVKIIKMAFIGQMIQHIWLKSKFHAFLQIFIIQIQKFQI